MTEPVPDRSALLTEQRNPRTMNLHRLSVGELVRTIRAEDAAVLEAMEAAEAALTAFLEDAEPRFTAGGRLIYLGAGTSGRLGVLDASEAPPTFHVEHGRVVGIIAGGARALRQSSEGAEDDPDGAADALAGLELTPLDTVIGVAAGGTTPYVRGGLAHAATLAPRCLRTLLTCTPLDEAGPVGEAGGTDGGDGAGASVDHLIVLPTGPEVITGSTRMKAGTATKLALNTISTTLMIREGRVHENLMVDLRATNAKLRDRAARIVATLTGLERPAALELLTQSGGEVKTAVVMHHGKVTAEAARNLLKSHNNRLAHVLADDATRA